MCGFGGFLSRGDIGTADSAERLLSQMGKAILHRGPDSEGVWCDRTAGLGFVHRRLAIVDLSAAGHQPMMSSDARYVLAFNGEIYNHLTLRKKLESSGASPSWRGHSDTETLLACFIAWGVEDTLKQCIGMFAIALWDRQSRVLILARDRMGEKPLYYGWQGQGGQATFLFGSELKALKVHPAFKAAIDRNALTLLMRHNYIPAPYSVYAGIAKLEPGCILFVSLDDPQPRMVKYWDTTKVALQGLASPFSGSPEEAVLRLEELAMDAVRQQMMADVPLGAFLSGGIDSSTIVALMQAQSSRPVKTFTIGFHEEGYNEAVHAKAVASHLGTEHTELYVTPDQALAVIPELPTLYDEPFSDSSQIPTYLISKLAREHVTVSLSGDAGDELFCGYSRYTQAARVWSSLERLPGFVRSGIANSIRAISVNGWNRLASPVLPLFSARKRNVGDKAHKLAELLNHPDFLSFYRRFVTHWPSPDEIIVDGREPTNYFTATQNASACLGAFESMMLADAMTYLCDDILVKVDRAAMGVSLETRVPFLDHRLFEFAWALPLAMKLRDGHGKWALKQVLYRHVPKELIERPKMGFGVPIDSWLRGPLRDWAENLLSETRLRQEGFFNPEPIRKKWAEHLSGNRNWQYHLWDVLMFQAWLDVESKHETVRFSN